MSEQEPFSICCIEWERVDVSGNVYTESTFADKTLPSGFVIKEDGLYYEGTFQPGQSRCVMPMVNKALAALLGVD